MAFYPCLFECTSRLCFFPVGVIQKAASRGSCLQMFYKIGALKTFSIFTGKHETSTQVFSNEYCEIFKSAFFHRTPLVATSEPINSKVVNQ